MYPSILGFRDGLQFSTIGTIFSASTSNPFLFNSKMSAFLYADSKSHGQKKGDGSGRTDSRKNPDQGPDANPNETIQQVDRREGDVDS